MRTIIKTVVLFILALAIMSLFLAPVAAEEEAEPPNTLPLAANRVLTPKEAVAIFADKYDANVNLALCIVRAESGFDPNAENPNSSASGLWQFIDSTFVSTAKRMGKEWTLDDKNDMMINARAGAWLLAHDGYTHWVVWPLCV